ncbi:Lecithin:cholesterol acyltransferase-domain-containing protein [Syncephalis fuscata]|nr:Lecithin:cholesterol acyltransferase-domain-containing protein [Syncephalis fuscata]
MADNTPVHSKTDSTTRQRSRNRYQNNDSGNNSDSIATEVTGSQTIPNEHSANAQTNNTTATKAKHRKPRRPRRSMSVEDYVHDSFLYHVNDEDYTMVDGSGVKLSDNRPIIRRRVFFALGLLLGLFIAVNFSSDNSPEFLRVLSAFVSMPLADLNFSALLPANIGVDEFLGNITAKLGPIAPAESELFEPGATMAREEGLKAKHPVILVPGIISTGLESWSTSECSRKYFRHRMWGTITMFRAVLLDKACWTEHMLLDPETGLDPPNVKLRAAQGLDAADYFIAGYWVWGKIIENLAAIGYDNNNMHLAAYDWRLSFANLEKRDQYFSKLKGTIELACKLDNQKVVLVAHSMGANVLMYFLKWVESPLGGNGGATWVNDHVHTFVNLAGPLLGLPKTVASVLSGEMRDTVQPLGEYVLERFYSKAERAALFRSWGGLSSMLPKGGNALWGDVETGAPDDLPESKISYSSLLYFHPERENHMEDEWNQENNTNTTADGLTPPASFSNMTVDAALELLHSTAGDNYNQMIKRYYSLGLSPTADVLAEYASQHQTWSNPLETTLPNAPDMQIYCLYGHGKETERGYAYTRTAPAPLPVVNSENAANNDTNNPPPPVCIDSSYSREDYGIENGVLVGEGDGTVPLISLGYMCVDGWRIPRYNPARIPVYTREFVHQPTSIVRNIRGGANSADHVDILGNAALTATLLRIAAGADDKIQYNDITSSIEGYSRQITARIHTGEMWPSNPVMHELPTEIMEDL